MTIHKLAMVCCMALGACACTDTRTVPIGDPGAERRADAAEAALGAAQTTLNNLRASLNSLAEAQDALRPNTNTEQRAAARAAVGDAQEVLAEVRQNLGQQPVSAAKTAADAALGAVDRALGAVDRALAANAALTSGGPVALASMHTTLERAQNALDDAQAELKTALAAEGLTQEIRTLLSQAQGTLTTAQVSLVPLLRDELAEAETQRDTARTERDTAQTEADRQQARADKAEAEVARLSLAFGKDLAISGREASQVSPADDAAVTLTPRRSGVMWSANTGFVATSPSWGVRTRYTIEDYGTASTARLDVEQDPVPYSAGGGMVIPGATGAPAANEFPGRGQVFRGIGNDHREFQLARQGSYGPSSDPTPVPAANIPRFPSGAGLRGNLRGHAISSFQYREEGGLTMKFGGLPPDQKPADAPDGSEGSLIYGDLEALTATGRYNCGSGTPPTDACDEAGTRDLTVSFGAPSRDPLGDPVYHWAVDVPDARVTIAAGTTANLDAAERADPDGVIGRYQMLLSNHAGVDDKGTEATGDDSERYLRYAAYGLFQFIDYQTVNDRPGRYQTFHYGFDAFGTHNPLPVATADSIAATLKGRTMAWLATGGLNTAVVSGLDRMRANVTLHACIGGSGCQAGDFTAPAGAAKPMDANKLTGAIHDLEIELSGGAWGDGNTPSHDSGHYAFSGDILLDGDIEASGAFAGTLRPDTMPSDGQWTASGRTAGPDTHGYTIRQQGAGRALNNRAMSHHWAHGEFEGVFYGPAEALEAAGTWWLPAVRADVVDKGVIGIIGSFGAVHQQEE